MPAGSDCDKKINKCWRFTVVSDHFKHKKFEAEYIYLSLYSVDGISVWMHVSFSEVVKGKSRGFDEEEYDFNDDEFFTKDKMSGDTEVLVTWNFPWGEEFVKNQIEDRVYKQMVYAGR